MRATDTAIEALLTRFNDGALDDALRLAREAVRDDPGHAGVRVLLAELLCFEGQFEKADVHLETAAQVDPGCAVGVAQFRQVVRAAVARADFYSAARVPDVLAAPGPEIQARLKAAVALHAGQPAQALAHLAEAEQLRPATPGVCDGQAFADVRDLDDVLGSVVEILTGNGQYFWVPFHDIDEMTFEPPRRPRDLLFRQTHVVTHGGTDGVVFIPALYHGSHAAADTALKLGRATDWRQTVGAPVQGLGQRVWLLGDRDAAIMDLAALQLGAGA